MTKAEVVNEIAQATGLDKDDVLVIVEKFMATVKESVAKGERVNLRGFGSFMPKVRAEKIGRNITKGTAVVVPEHTIPSFKPSKTFKQEVN